MNAYFGGILKEKSKLRCMQNVLLFIFTGAMHRHFSNQIVSISAAKY